jgi:replication factor A1
LSKTLSKEEVIDIIVRDTEYTHKQVQEQISETVKMMDNMVNEEGAAYVVANNLGVIINLDQSTEAYKLNQLVPGQSNVTVICRVKRIYPIKEFTRKDNTGGKVRNIEIMDKSASARVALWDANVHVIDEKKIEIGSIIRISGANTKMGYNDQIELSIGSHGLIDAEVAGIDEADIPEVKSSKFIELKNLINNMGEVSVEGKIVDRQGIVEFERSGKTGRVTSVSLRDLSGKSRITFWNDSCEEALKWNIGDIVQITDLRIGENKYGDKELTFNPYSKINQATNVDKYSSIDTTTSKILSSLSEIEDGLQNVTVVGKIIDIGEIRKFEREGRSNQVANLVIKDSSQSLRINLWGELANISLELEPGEIIRVHEAQAKLSDFSGEVELSCGHKSKIERSPADVDQKNFSFEESPILLSDITDPRSGLYFKVQIERRFEEREIELKDGTKTSVLNCSIIDSEGNQGKIAAWGDSIKNLDDFHEGDGIEIISARAKPGTAEYGPEITITNKTILKRIDADDIFPLIRSADKLQSGMSYQKTSLEDLTKGSKVHVQGTIVKAYKPAIYDACSECARKVIIEEGNQQSGSCKVHGEVNFRPRMILTIALDDTQKTCIVKLFDKNAESLLNMTAEEAKDMISRLSDEEAPITKSEIKMKEIWIEGKVVFDEVREALQITADKFGEVEITKEANDILGRFEQY